MLAEGFMMFVLTVTGTAIPGKTYHDWGDCVRASYVEPLKGKFTKCVKTKGRTLPSLTEEMNAYAMDNKERTIEYEKAYKNKRNNLLRSTTVNTKGFFLVIKKGAIYVPLKSFRKEHDCRTREFSPDLRRLRTRCIDLSEKSLAEALSDLNTYTLKYKKFLAERQREKALYYVDPTTRQLRRKK